MDKDIYMPVMCRVRCRRKVRRQVNRFGRLMRRLRWRMRRRMWLDRPEVVWGPRLRGYRPRRRNLFLRGLLDQPPRDLKFVVHGPKKKVPSYSHLLYLFFA